jgi:hypothetical protein
MIIESAGVHLSCFDVLAGIIVGGVLAPVNFLIEIVVLASIIKVFKNTVVVSLVINSGI